MNNARRYRGNAADCLLAAKTCEPSYRGLTLPPRGTRWPCRTRQWINCWRAGARPRPRMKRVQLPSRAQGREMRDIWIEKSRLWDLGLACGSLSLVMLLLTSVLHKALGG
jgi:hypothetical protein